MKKILYTICLAAAPLFFQACDNLDLSPIDYNASGNYWQNETQVKGFVDGLHNDLRSQLNQQYLEYGELRGEIQKTSANLCGPNSKMGNYIINSISESLTLKSNWGGFYSKILQVNLMIEQLENGCAFLSDSKRDYYKGVAYGLRAYYYFWLYRSYGGVPLELTVKVLSKYRCILLPDRVKLSESDKRALLDFANRGGSIVASYESIFDELGIRKSAPSEFDKDYIRCDFTEVKTPFLSYSSAYKRPLRYSRWGCDVWSGVNEGRTGSMLWPTAAANS